MIQQQDKKKNDGEGDDEH
jgi:hypothetical protein